METPLETEPKEAKTKRQLDYRRYQLTTNPFTGCVPRDSVDFIVPRGEELEQAIWALMSAGLGISTHTVVVGGYGNGKTHLLKYIGCQSFLQSHGPNGKVPLAVYVHTPGENFKQLYGNFMLAMGHEFVQRMIWRYLGMMCLQYPQDYGLTKDHSRLLQKDPEGLKQLVSDGQVLLSDVVLKAKNRLIQEVKLIDYATAMLYLLFQEHSFIVWKWLVGESVPYTQRRELGLSMSISNDERALRAFLSLKHLLHIVGYDVLILLLDEFELIATMNERSRQNVLNEIRHLIDLTPSGLCIFLGCAPEAWRIVSEHYHALLDRFSHVVFLEPLDEAQTRQVITSYLSRVRCGSRKCDAIFPFAPKTVESIAKLSLGNVRSALKLCQMAIDFGLMNGLDTLSGKQLDTLFSGLLQPGRFTSAERDAEAK